MSHATFYIIDDAAPEARLKLAGQQAAWWYQQGQSVFLLAETREQAEWLDEYLWQQDPDNFVPHNLIGEGPRQGSPVEIGWPGLRHSGRRAVLINLSQDAPNFAVTFAQVVDFVPCDEKLKQQARERYKAYRLAGIQLQTTPAPESP
ncbi:DNA polymerase III subunit chi [Photobacterium halotolerans]|uniref:DNA polymerase III subunit chi n=1 Tax=Photobacterium halotolerans TaxID=265726 RepID=A0A7X4W9B4_9GAMM|nr:DNA polymerase III subunit chi [Photobacterium halotolerans]NAW63690.1 DNA polymerase III subunit chi [Photobacterium halotolerans]NAW88905.1 DNA polymerase III subunit chi [Photobacterium halotolerans]NAX48240.1 DNA polymerase III subunit chi [Photobacterium halotolerans]